MDIHVVRRGDSLYGIAQRYGVSADELYRINRLNGLPYLVPGQALFVPTTETPYTVQPGDSLWGIARKYGTTTAAVIALNGIEDPANIQPGTVLRIPVGAKNYGFIETNAYLEPTSPERETALIGEVGEYLTYLSPFSYQAGADGSLTPIRDETMIREAYQTRAAPLLVVTNFADGNFSTEIVNTILEDEALQDALIANMLDVMKEKGYYGVNIDFERISPENRQRYNVFLQRVVDALHPEGFVVSTALAPKPEDYSEGAWHGAHDYAAHGDIVDFVVIMTYEWGWSGGPPYAVAPIDLVEDVIRYAASVIPPEKIVMGMPLYGYDWPLPYMPDGEWAKRISPQDAIKLAAETGSEIRFDEQTQSPTFKYYDENGVQHEVWFEDARSVQEKLKLINKYGLRGASYWVLGVPFPQNWAVLDDMYTIVKVVPPT